jgi:hypothetical protein
MAEVEWQCNGISYHFRSNRATLLEASGFFPPTDSLLQPRCRLETRKRCLFGTGRRFTVLVFPMKPDLGFGRQGPLLPQPEAPWPARNQCSL